MISDESRLFDNSFSEKLKENEATETDPHGQAFLYDCGLIVYGWIGTPACAISVIRGVFE
jgi:hypothetical protein